MVKLKLRKRCLEQTDAESQQVKEKGFCGNVPFLIHQFLVPSVWDAGMQAEPLYIRAYEGQKASCCAISDRRFCDGLWQSALGPKNPTVLQTGVNLAGLKQAVAMPCSRPWAQDHTQQLKSSKSSLKGTWEAPRGRGPRQRGPKALLLQ